MIDAPDAAQPVLGDEHSSVASPSSTRREVADVVIIGNCLSEGMTAGMSSMAAATERFRFTAIPLHLKTIEDPDCKHVLARATHVFVQTLAGMNMDRLQELTGAETLLCRYPDVVFRSAWPFEAEGSLGDQAAAASPGGVIHHQDGALARLRTLEPDKKKRIERYRALDFRWALRIDSIIEAQEQFLTRIDNLADVKLGRFITDNIREQQLFYNSTHPSGLLFEKLCAFCWQTLGLPGDSPPSAAMDDWRGWSVPVHPVIAQRLGLRWATESTRYEYCTLGKVTWQEWVEAYIDAYG